MIKMKRGIVFLLFFGFIFLLFLHPIDAGDFFHHLNSGKYVVDHLALPYKDNLSFTANGLPWVAYGWGSGVIFYFLYSLFGPNSISIFFALLGTLAVFLIYRILKFISLKPTLSLILALTSASLASLRWPARPEVLGPFFVIGTIYLLVIYKRPKWFLVPYFWIWAIIYGASTFLGILVFGFYLIANKIFDKKSATIFLLSIVASFLSGYGASSFFYIFQIPKIAPHVGEWLPLAKTLNPGLPDLVLFYQYIVLAYLVFVAFYIGTFLFALIKKREILANNLFMTGLSLAVLAPFYTNRFVNLGAFVGSIFIGLVVANTPAKAQKVILVLLILFTISTSYIRFRNFIFGPGLSPSPFNTRLTAFLRQNKINGNIYSIQEIGSFLSWELPNSKIFLDTRDDLYVPTGIFNELAEVDNGKIPLEAVLDKYRADIVIGDFGTAQTYKSLIYNPGWKLIYLTDGYFVLVRTNLAKELTTFDSIDPLKTPPAKPGQATQAESQIQKLVDLDAISTENKVRLIEIKLALGKPEEAVAILNKLNLTKPSYPKQSSMELANHELAGKIYLAAGKCAEAFKNLKTAESLSYNKLIFFPKVRLPTLVDEYLGEYYLSCQNDKAKAKKYFTQFLKGNISPLKRREVEMKVEQLNNSNK